MAMYVLRLIRTPEKEYKSPRSLGVRVNESRLYIYIYIYIYILGCSKKFQSLNLMMPTLQIVCLRHQVFTIKFSCNLEMV